MTLLLFPRTRVGIVVQHLDSFCTGVMDVHLGRLPIEDNRRQKVRDLKLQRREDDLARTAGLLKRVCSCNICISENRSFMLRATVDRHLEL